MKPLNFPRKVTFAIFFLSVVYLLPSCRKQANETYPLVNNTSFRGLDKQAVISAADLQTWLTTSLTDDMRYDLYLDKAQQNIINGLHVIRIPAGKGATLFMTKANDKLQVFLYKWLDKDPGAKDFTGNLIAYSFQDNGLRTLVYKDGKIVKAGLYQNNLTTTTNGGLNKLAVANKNSLMDIGIIGGGILGRLWCWLTFGTWISQSDIDNGYSTGANGEVGKVGCDRTGDNDETISWIAAGFGGGVPVTDFYLGNYQNATTNYISNDNSFGGIAPYGGGNVWITKYIPDHPDGCPVDGQPQSTINDDTSGGPCDPNSGHWVSVEVVVPGYTDEASSVTATDPDDPSWWNDATTTYASQTLPTYANLYANYPKVTHNGVTQDMPPDQVYNLIGGNVLNLYNSNPIANGNACAARVSRALLYSGIQIPYIPNKTFQGSDGKYYFVAASALFDWMTKTFGSTGSNVITVTHTQGGTNGANFQSFLSGRKGIYILKPVSRSPTSGFGASGHATVYNGSNCMITSEGHPGEYFNARGGVEMIRLWVLN